MADIEALLDPPALHMNYGFETVNSLYKLHQLERVDPWAIAFTSLSYHIQPKNLWEVSTIHGLAGQ